MTASIGTDMAKLARDLLAGLLAEPWGQMSPSVYETGRLIALAPWLRGHANRLAFLMATQRPDGGWGGPDGYLLVPSLSAVDGLLHALRRTSDPAAVAAVSAQPSGTELAAVHHIGGYPRLVAAVDRGLRVLFDLLRSGRRVQLPDTPGIEIIVPALVESVNGQLDQLAAHPLPGLDAWSGSARLGLPQDVCTATLAAIRAALRTGARLPDKLLHALEIAGDAARRAPGVHPVPLGTVGASPAATAAWLSDGTGDRTEPALRYLDEVATRYGGPVPSVLPITAVERSWVLTTLVRAGIPLAVPRELVDDLDRCLAENGTPGGPGLPPDADTTSVVLLALSQQGVLRRPDCLWPYRDGTHFCAWVGERTPSPTVNAHVLETLVDCAGRGGSGTTTRLTTAIRDVTRWLRDVQHPDGSWTDKWHSSPYYATACCTIAIDGLRHSAMASAVDRHPVRAAVDWVLATQRVDGSWGRWAGTVEETAYALQVLLLTAAPGDPTVGRAAARGYAYLRATIDSPDESALWHDKDLYRPEAVVRATALGALHLAHRSPAVVALAT